MYKKGNETFTYDIMRIPKQINKLTRLTVHSKTIYWSLSFSKRNHSPNKTVTLENFDRSVSRNETIRRIKLSPTHRAGTPLIKPNTTSLGFTPFCTQIADQRGAIPPTQPYLHDTLQENLDDTLQENFTRIGKNRGFRLTPKPFQVPDSESFSSDRRISSDSSMSSARLHAFSHSLHACFKWRDVPCTPFSDNGAIFKFPSLYLPPWFKLFFPNQLNWNSSLKHSRLKQSITRIKELESGRLFEVDLGLFDGSQLETVAAVKGDNEEEKQEHAEIIAAEEPNADKAPCNNDATTKTCSEDYIALLIEHDNEESDDGSEIKAEIAKSNPKKKSQKQIFRGGFKVEPSTTSNKKGGNVIKETSEPKSTKMKAQIKSNKKDITKNKSKVAIKNGETSKKTEVLKIKGDSNPQQSNKKRKTPLKQNLNPPPRHSDTKKPKFGGEGQNSQTIKNVGVYLPESVFWHNQLYVALLRDIMRHYADT
ncbi:hypothetical protein LXL04_013891 [Taraxacum kok-saghyz]